VVGLNAAYQVSRDCIWGYNGCRDNQKPGLFHVLQVVNHEPKSHEVVGKSKKQKMTMVLVIPLQTSFTTICGTRGSAETSHVPPSCVNGRGKAPASPESVLAHHVKVMPVMQSRDQPHSFLCLKSKKKTKIKIDYRTQLSIILSWYYRSLLVSQVFLTPAVAPEALGGASKRAWKMSRQRSDLRTSWAIVCCE
jgi:hypothetical protein